MGLGGILITYHGNQHATFRQIVEVRNIPEPDTDFRDTFYLKNVNFFQKWGDVNLLEIIDPIWIPHNTLWVLDMLMLIDTHEVYEKNSNHGCPIKKCTKLFLMLIRKAKFDKLKWENLFCFR